MHQAGKVPSTHLTLDLGNVGSRPSLVRSHRHNTRSVHSSLQQSLRVGKDGAKVVRWWFARRAEGEGVGELESRVGRDNF